VSPAQTDKSGNAAVFSTTPKTSPSATRRRTWSTTARQDDPGDDQGTGLTAYVGGTTASYIDLATKISDKLFLVIGIVVLLSFLLLTLASARCSTPDLRIDQSARVGARYGVLTAVFEKGFALS
jgi:RND superfamily putative drug exporter